jgi:hypothetical protein
LSFGSDTEKSFLVERTSAKLGVRLFDSYCLPLLLFCGDVLLMVPYNGNPGAFPAPFGLKGLLPFSGAPLLLLYEFWGLLFLGDVTIYFCTAP